MVPLTAILAVRDYSYKYQRHCSSSVYIMNVIDVDTCIPSF